MAASASRIFADVPLLAQTNPVKMGHEDAVYLAKLAEQAERYEGTYARL